MQSSPLPSMPAVLFAILGKVSDQPLELAGARFPR
jgi:hypothetical protein